MQARTTARRTPVWGQVLGMLLIAGLLLSALPVKTAHAASTSPVAPGAATSPGKGWKNATNVFTENGSYTFSTAKKKQLKLSSFGSFGIPDGAVIEGVEITVNGHTDGRQALVQVSGNGGATWSVAKTTSLPIGATDDTVTLGGATDKWLPYGPGWSSTSFTGNNFRVKLTTNNGTGTISVDQVLAKVYFAPPPTTLTLPLVTAPYGGTATLSATLTVTAGGAPISGKTVDFKLNDVFVGSDVTDGSGVATFEADVSGLAVGEHPDFVRAEFAGDETYGGTFGLGDLTLTAVPGVLFENSVAVPDGWILESSENSGRGGTKNKGSMTVRLGDDAHNRQYRGILSFDTSGLPEDGITITNVTLMVRLAGTKGKSPFLTHGPLLVDLRSGLFKDNIKLQLGDFQAVPTSPAVMTVPNTPSVDWYSTTLDISQFSLINRGGVTQLRLRFQKGDNNDEGADFLKFFTGNALLDDRPRLIVDYTTP